MLRAAFILAGRPHCLGQQGFTQQTPYPLPTFNLLKYLSHRLAREYALAYTACKQGRHVQACLFSLPSCMILKRVASSILEIGLLIIGPPPQH